MHMSTEGSHLQAETLAGFIDALGLIDENSMD